MEIERSLTIKNEEGMHARPAGLFVKAASAFSADIGISYGDKTVNGKSIMSIMSLGLTKDAEFVLTARGDDAASAVEQLADLVNKKFNITY